jgi:hypothetical protein
MPHIVFTEEELLNNQKIKTYAKRTNILSFITYMKTNTENQGPLHILYTIEYLFATFNCEIFISF